MWSSSTRRSNESALVAALQGLLPASWDLRVFNGSRGSWKSDMELFRRADVVVGVHGGALANIVACQRGAAVIEIGFRTVAGAAYGHVAKALGLHYRKVLVEADPLGRGLGVPQLTLPISQVLDAVREYLQEIPEKQSAKGEVVGEL
jgi:hypothetical protein